MEQKRCISSLTLAELTADGTVQSIVDKYISAE